MTDTGSGILIINKERGFTSFDVVAKLRGILHIKKIGHTGTLDPDAEGVLCVCIGKATKLIEYMTEHDKEYVTTLLLGTVTDTHDISGEVISKVEDIDVSNEVFTETLERFVGDIEQVPPMYSAKKVNGMKLYEAARKGIEINRDPVKIHIDKIDILEYKIPRVKLRIACSKGTYIRTLCNDIGKSLGCGGCMETLLRTRVGEYGLDEAHTLSKVEDAVKNGTLKDIIRPIDSALSLLPAYKCSLNAYKRLQNGNKLYSDDLEYMDEIFDSLEDTGINKEMNKNSDLIRVYTPDGDLAAVYRHFEDHYKVDKFFI